MFFTNGIPKFKVKIMLCLSFLLSFVLQELAFTFSVCMVTSDNINTDRAITKECGILTSTLVEHIILAPRIQLHTHSFK
ncbi:hypothetical protein HanIR_Chr15g0749051 [Helianthus annuus]|nr:hypothetical protein HanIR_Chr15g0749051 [Helianthus annuus]